MISRKLWKEIQDENPNGGVVVLYKPEGVDYYVTQSPFQPWLTKEILEDVLSRCQDVGS